MRLGAIIVIGFFLALPAMAQTDDGSAAQPSSGSVRNFGGATCRERIPCVGNSRAAAVPSIYSNGGNACMSEGFGYFSPTGYFDPNAGVNADGCLVPIPGALPKGAGPQLTPACCLVKMPDNTCVFRCELNVYQ